MNKLGPKNSFNLNIAIHVPNTMKSPNTTGFTLTREGDDDVGYVKSSPGAVRLDDVVEISSAARNLMAKRYISN